MRSVILFFSGTLCLLLASPWISPTSAAERPPGLTSTRPTRGPFVKTPQGYMTPYVAVIPGTRVRFTMTPIAGGELRVPKERGSREGEIRIAIPPFWIGQHEVTWEEYAEFMALYHGFVQLLGRRDRKQLPLDHIDAVTAPTPVYEPLFRMEFADHPRKPAATMTQFAARQYTKWLSRTSGVTYRLPFEAEWQYACAAGNTTPWSFGKDPRRLPEFAAFAKNTRDAGPPVVGSRKPNRWGLYDMHGSVAEWVLDAPHPQGLRRLKAGVTPLTQAILWPQGTAANMALGGSWQDEAQECRTISRKVSTKDWWSGDAHLPPSPWWLASGSDVERGIGFRLVRPLITPSKELQRRLYDAHSQQLRKDVSDRIIEGRGIGGLANLALPARLRAQTQPPSDWMRPWRKRGKRSKRK